MYAEAWMSTKSRSLAPVYPVRLSAETSPVHENLQNTVAPQLLENSHLYHLP